MTKITTKPKQVTDLSLPAPSNGLPAKIGNRFQKGQIANPNGRPKGARERLTQSFIERLADSFDKHGVKALDRLAQSDPGTYVRVIASLMPKEVKLDAGPLGDLSQHELDALASAARKAVAQAEQG